MSRRTTTLAVALVAGVVLAGCGGASPGPAGDPASAPSTLTSSSAPSTTGAPTSPAPATDTAGPERDACYRLTYDESVAPTSDRAPVGCARRHTAQTFHVGTIDELVDAPLPAVDSPQVQDRIAQVCPRRLAGFLGATEKQLRLSMVRPVWFSPTLEEADAGQDWFRCDVVVLAGRESLLRVRGDLTGAFDTPAGRQRFGLCATARPGAPSFERVVCSRDDSWRAVDTVDLEGQRYPGEEEVRAAGQQPCEDVARELAEDPLDFIWGYEWPTQDQWRAGTRHGICWVPGD